MQSHTRPSFLTADLQISEKSRHFSHPGVLNGPWFTNSMKVQWPKTGLILQGDCGLAKPYNTQLICIPPSSPVPQQRFLFFLRHIKNVSFSSHPELPPPFTPCKHLLHYFPFQMPFDSYLDFSHQIQVSRLYCYDLTPLMIFTASWLSCSPLPTALFQVTCTETADLTLNLEMVSPFSLFPLLRVPFI